MKPIEEKHSQQISVWVKPGMKRTLIDVSEQTGMPVAQLVRGLMKIIYIAKDELKANEMH